MKLIAALACAAALLVPAAAAPDTAPYTIVGGTWVSGWQGQLVGPAWWLDGPTQIYGVTLVGPDGFTQHMGGPNQRFPGMPSTRSTYWCSTCGEASPGGSWYAIGDGDHTKVTFTIDQTSRMQPVQIDRYSGDANTFTASWMADASAQSFIVYIQDEGDTSARDWTVGEVMPAGSTTVTFTNMGLNPDWAYEFDIFAFSGDIIGSSAPNVFNIASNRADFVPSVLATHPQTGDPKYSCTSVSAAPRPYACSAPGACSEISQGCDIIVSPVVNLFRSCATQSGWTVTATKSTKCTSAKTIVRSYLANSKCATTGKHSAKCSASGYQCIYTKDSLGRYVRCNLTKGLVEFRTPA